MIQKYHFWFENLLFFFLLQPKLVIFLLEWINDQCNFYFTRFVKSFWKDFKFLSCILCPWYGHLIFISA